MPGVASVGFSTMPILAGYGWQNAILGKDFEGAPIEEQPVLSEIGPGYFVTLGIPIIAGRAFTAQDHGPANYKCAVVNENLCQAILPEPKSDRAALRARERDGAGQPGHRSDRGSSGQKIRRSA
jgi:hypothetical protein